MPMNAPFNHSPEAAEKARILAEALPYIQQFHGKTIVVKFGGNAMTDEELKSSFARDVVLLKLVGMNPVVVHGGGPQIEQLLARLGKKGEFVQGMRVTDAETMDVVEMVLGGQVNKEVVELINQAGGKAVGLTGQDGAFIHARKMLLPSKDNGSVDLGQVGEVESIDPAVIEALEAGGFIPVVAPIGTGARRHYLQHQRRPGRGQAGRGAARREARGAHQYPGRARQGRQAPDGPHAQEDRRPGGEGRDLRRHAAEDRLGARRRAQRREERATSSTGACRTPCCLKS